MTKTRLRTRHAILYSALLLLPATGSAAKHMSIDETVIQTARVWIDGIPYYPPYNLEIVGDTAFVVNGVVAQACPTPTTAKTETPTPCELVRDKVAATALEAWQAGLSDSAVVAAACAAFNADTSACGVATSRPPWGLLDLTKRDTGGKILSMETVYVTRPSEQQRPKATRRDQLEQWRRMTENSIASGGIIFWERPGRIQSCPASLFPDLLRDIRDAALGDSFTVANWYRSAVGKPRLMNPQTANSIARNVKWIGR